MHTLAEVRHDFLGEPGHRLRAVPFRVVARGASGQDIAIAIMLGVGELRSQGSYIEKIEPHAISSGNVLPDRSVFLGTACFNTPRR